MDLENAQEIMDDISDLPSSEQTIGMMMYADEKRRLHDYRSMPVVIHNDFIQGRRYSAGAPFQNSGKSWSKTERKIFLYLVASIKPDDKQLACMTFDLKEFCKICGIGGKRPSDMYKHLKDSIKSLADRSDWVTSQDGKERLVRIVDTVVLDTKTTSKIEIRLHDHMIPYLLELKDNYTAFPLENELRMRSVYGMQLHELLKSLCYRGPLIKFEVNDFKERMDATHFTGISALKTKVIEPALRDINTYSSLYADVQYEKTGRSITHIVFYVRDLYSSDDPADRMELEKRIAGINHEFDEEDQMTLWPIVGETAGMKESVF